MLESVVNVSEGDRRDVVAEVAAAAGDDLLDLHADPDHNRAVLTLVGESAPRRVAGEAVARLDLRRHRGAHPRFGVVDVVPFVPLAGSTMADAVGARDRFAAWIAVELGVPAFLYGPDRSLPDVRRHAFAGLAPDTGPAAPHPTAGAVAVGARPLLVAWNLWLAEPNLALAREVAAAVRGPDLRALGLAVGSRVQVSMNLIAPDRLGPAEAWDHVAALVDIAGAELVGLVPAAVLDRTDPARWEQLDLGPDRTIEAAARCEGVTLGRGGPGHATAPGRRRPGARGPAACQALALVAARAWRASERWRRMRRRSRSLMPPQMPNFSPLTSAYSRHCAWTMQPRQTSLASRVDAPRSGKKRSGSTPRQLA